MKVSLKASLKLVASVDHLDLIDRNSNERWFYVICSQRYSSQTNLF